ncbi:MAG TPA: glycogen debranching enzyme GlgX [Proteus sp.]|nr:glycogen debranching enzyme GlgX [Proteus sp. (in: enterobacteria)]
MSLDYGRPFPMGSHYDGYGVNFTLFSQNATKVTLCLFDKAGKEIRYQLPGKTGHIWHGYLPGAGPGLHYGYRVEGKWDPEHGLFYQPQQLLLDPYAKQVTEIIDNTLPFTSSVFNVLEHDNSAMMPKGIITDDSGCFCHSYKEKETYQRLNTPWSETIIYEGNVKGLTKLHPDIPNDIAGTYAALGHPAFISHLQKLGITALELLPIQYHLTEPHLNNIGLKNYWGYNVLAPFALATQYYSNTGRNIMDEFREAIKHLHKANIEVILDVVFNHTAELSDQTEGYIVSQRGIDNQAYYWLNDENKAQNWTGCGNTLNLNRPETVQWVMDCLRYWVTEYHVDGFRFDLATSLGRVPYFDVHSPLLTAIRQDPLLSRIKLIAEPWDLGSDGYQVGNFPVPFAEWNDTYRDVVRRFWLWKDVSIATFADIITGSAKLYHKHGRPPYSSINMLTSHDGFTLRDLVSYQNKHNEENGESNLDGHNTNYSVNFGEEGLIVNNQIEHLRLHAIRNLFATLLLSRGTPHLLAGDELGNTQYGNNNAYCQDNKVSWIKWFQPPYNLTDYISHLIELRRQIIPLQSLEWWETNSQNIIWLNQHGEPISNEDWQQLPPSPLQIVLAQQWILMINPLRNSALFSLPQGQWSCLLDTANWPRCYPTQKQQCEIQPSSITLWRSSVFYPQSCAEKLPTISSQTE